MFKWIVVINLVAMAVLFLPDWKPPYSYAENLLILLGYVGLFGPWVLLFLAFLNRLIDISFRNDS